MSVPAPTEQVEFLVKLQQLLAEGQFTASYKFALLLALADLSVELGDDSGGPLRVAVDRIAEKFIGYYWRQAAPYVPMEAKDTATVLQQNTGRQAEIVSILDQARARHGPKIQALRRVSSEWVQVKSTVARVVRVITRHRSEAGRGRCCCGPTRS